MMLLVCKTWHETKTHLDWCAWDLNLFLKSKNLNSLKWSIFFQLIFQKKSVSFWEEAWGHNFFLIAIKNNLMSLEVQILFMTLKEEIILAQKSQSFKVFQTVQIFRSKTTNPTVTPCLLSRRHDDWEVASFWEVQYSSLVWFLGFWEVIFSS